MVILAHAYLNVFQKEDDDGDGNSSFTCNVKCIKIGSSGAFETYKKSDADVIGGFFAPVQVFYFGETQDCRIKVEPGSKQSTTTQGDTGSSVGSPESTAASQGSAGSPAGGTDSKTNAETDPDTSTLTDTSRGSPELHVVLVFVLWTLARVVY